MIADTVIDVDVVYDFPTCVDLRYTIRRIWDVKFLKLDFKLL